MVCWPNLATQDLQDCSWQVVSNVCQRSVWLWGLHAQGGPWPPHEFLSWFLQTRSLIRCSTHAPAVASAWREPLGDGLCWQKRARVLLMRAFCCYTQSRQVTATAALTIWRLLHRKRLYLSGSDSHHPLSGREKLLPPLHNSQSRELIYVVMHSQAINETPNEHQLLPAVYVSMDNKYLNKLKKFI